MNEIIKKIQSFIDDETRGLSKEEYRYVLDELHSDMSIRLMALDDDDIENE